jgi:uncharacterized membrane protein (UPF0127 family)
MLFTFKFQETLILIFIEVEEPLEMVFIQIYKFVLKLKNISSF